VLAVAGLTGLLIVLGAILALIGSAAGGDGGEPEVAATPAATSTPEPSPTLKPKPTPEPLTPEEELERQEAIDLVSSRGFDVVRKRDWKPEDTLQVLIGRSSTGGKLAFFFVDGVYMGNDDTETSVQLRVVDTEDLDVVLRYGIFESGDAPDTPTGEPVTVRFRYDGGGVAPVEAVPAAEQRAPTA